MTEPSAPSSFPPAEPPVDQPVVGPSPSSLDGLGLAGFIVSLAGLLFGWCFWPLIFLAPIGMVLAFIALFRPPRGLAIAGFIIGLVGTLLLAAGLVLFLFLGAGALGFKAAMPYFEGQADAIRIQGLVEAYQRANGVPPEDLDDLSGLEAQARLDFWGHAYRFEIDDTTGRCVIRSNGEDGVEGTEDDLEFRP